MSWLGVGALAGGVALAVASVWTDVRRREIPHWLVGGIVAFWAVAAVFDREALGGTLLASILCGVAMLAVGFVLHAFGWLGGGDGKLLAALALWLGPADAGWALMATGAIGLLLTLAAWFRNRDWRLRGIPYAIAIAPPASALLAMRAMA